MLSSLRTRRTYCPIAPPAHISARVTHGGRQGSGHLGGQEQGTPIRLGDPKKLWAGDVSAIPARRELQSKSSSVLSKAHESKRSPLLCAATASITSCIACRLGGDALQHITEAARTRTPLGRPRAAQAMGRERPRRMKTVLQHPCPIQPPLPRLQTVSSKQQALRGDGHPPAQEDTGWTRAGCSKHGGRRQWQDISACRRLSQRGHLCPCLLEAELSFARQHPSSKCLLQVAGHRQCQVVVVGGSHQLDAQRQALAAQAQWALRDGQAQDVEDGWKREDHIRALPQLTRRPVSRTDQVRQAR